jgi:hypothetical protein
MDEATGSGEQQIGGKKVSFVDKFDGWVDAAAKQKAEEAKAAEAARVKAEEAIQKAKDEAALAALRINQTGQVQQSQVASKPDNALSGGRETSVVQNRIGQEGGNQRRTIGG